MNARRNLQTLLLFLKSWNVQHETDPTLRQCRPRSHLRYEAERSGRIVEAVMMCVKRGRSGAIENVVLVVRVLTPPLDDVFSYVFDAKRELSIRNI